MWPAQPDTLTLMALRRSSSRWLWLGGCFVVGSLLALASCVGDDAAPVAGAADGGDRGDASSSDGQTANVDAGPDSSLVDGAIEAAGPDYDGGKGSIVCTASMDCAASVSYCCTSAINPQGCVPRSAPTPCLQEFRCSTKDNCLAGTCVADIGVGTACKAAAAAARERVACLVEGDCPSTAATCKTGCFLNNTTQGVCLASGEPCP